MPSFRDDLEAAARLHDLGRPPMDFHPRYLWIRAALLTGWQMRAWHRESPIGTDMEWRISIYKPSDSAERYRYSAGSTQAEAMARMERGMETVLKRGLFAGEK